MTRKKGQKKISVPKENPFNIKVNRSKHSVLGQKVRGTRGVPGVSRSVGNAKRKEDFHKKRIHSQKANKFVDKRLMDNSLSFEEQATLRLVEERKRKFKRNIFNLNEEESLTHKGIPLEYQNSFNDTVNDSDDDEQLDPKFVKHAHFGGFEDTSAAPKSRKEMMEKMIADYKQRKMERKMAREKNEDMVAELDQQWKELHQTLPDMKGSKKQKATSEVVVTSEKKDAFNVLLNELKFEKKATPAVRVKTPEEIAIEEKEKMKKLKEDQFKRMMNPMDDKESKQNLLSADSIYDGLDIQFEPIDDEESKVNTNADNPEGEESDANSSDMSEDENELNNIEDNDIESMTGVVDSMLDVPDSIEMLRNVIESHTEELHVIVENIVKDKIKSKSKENLEKIETFFAVLLEYIMNLGNSNKTLEVLDDILPLLYAMAEFSPTNTAVKLLTFLDKEQEIFQQSKGKKMKQQFPRFQSLVLFKIISVIYSVSDFKHPVVTPTIAFMCDILSSAYYITFQNTISRLFICKVFYDCVSFSKRYVPEVFWFLNKTLELANHNDKRFNLFINEAVTNEERVEINFEKTGKSCSSDVKVSIIFEIIELLHRFSPLYEQLQCHREIFSESLTLSKRLPTGNYPNFLKESVSKFIDDVEKVKNVYKPLAFENKKPVPLKLFEPAFDSKFTRKKDDIKKKRKLVKSVNQKIRKEEKGLLREMRRNNQVIASEKLKEKLESDAERKRKVKQLYQELAMQEGEYKKFVKKK